MSSQSFAFPTTPSGNWIISRNQDLAWFIGSALVSYAVLALMAAGFPMAPLYLIWLVGIDGPHVVATITRTYFDAEERRRLGRLLWVVVPAMATGPVMVASGAEALFYIFAVSWLHFHIAKQHFGFVMLYKHKARERDRLDFRLERWFLLTSLMLPFAWFAVPAFFPALAGLAGFRRLELLAIAAYGLLAAAFLMRQLHKWRSSMPLNAPKLLLFCAVVPLQWITFQFAASSGPDGLVRAGVVLGLFHSFQYHRLMWFHNRNRYAGEANRDSSGLAAVLARRVIYYFGAALGLNLLLTILPKQVAPGAYVNAAAWGIPFTHYILDSVIWRVRGNRELASALKLS